MDKKFLLPVMLVIALTAAAFAQANGVAKIAPYPYPVPNNDFPDVLVMKGVAVKGEDIKSAIFLATDKIDTYKFRENYLLIDGVSHVLKPDSVKYDDSTKTAILKFSSDGKIFKLVVKVHRMNYQDVVTASGVFNGHVLNLRLVGDTEQIYRIMEKPLGKDIASTTYPESDLTKEEIDAINDALK